MYKLLLTDLDETLLVDHHIPSMNIDAIEKARKKGVKVVPCTGRSYQMIQEVLQELGSHKKAGEYSICFNGGLVVENKDDKVLYFNGLGYEHMVELLEYSKRFDVGVMIFTLDMCYLVNPDQDEIDRKIAQNGEFEVIYGDVDLSLFEGKEIAKLLYIKKDMDYLKMITQSLSDEIETMGISVSYSSHRYLEFNASGVNKGAGLAFLARHLGVEISEVISIGDNYNDLEMLEVAGLGCAVTSAYQDIKDVCDYVTKKDYFEGAVSEVITKFILEEQENV